MNSESEGSVAQVPLGQLPVPYFQDEWSTIYCGDSPDIAPLLTGIDAVISDPPYGIGYQHSGGGGGKHHRINLVPILGDDRPFDPAVWIEWSNVILWGADHFYHRLPDRGRWLAFNKLGDMQAWDSFCDVEFAWHSKEGAARIFSMLYKGIASDKAEESVTREHPSQKPIRLMLWCLEQAKITAGQTILDPYMGSGTTLVAAKLRGVKAVGIELEEKYCAIAKRRLAQGVLIPA